MKENDPECHDRNYFVRRGIKVSELSFIDLDPVRIAILDPRQHYHHARLPMELRKLPGRPV